MKATTDVIGRQVEQQFILRRLEQQAAAQKNGASK